MSNRTLVELNHDYCPSDESSALRWALDMCAYMRSGVKYYLPKGVTLKHMRHHSEPEPHLWVDVKVGLPKIGQRVLVFFANDNPPYYDFWTYSGTNQYFCDKPSRMPKLDVTHWRELPAPPETRATEGK